MNPRYPVYIISKGRWESRLTAKALERMAVPYHIVVEPQEHSAYAQVIDPAKILTLPFSNLGHGSIPARNWVWEHALATGAKRHWILDDNISGFLRLHDNRKIPMADGTCLCVCEDFADRYTNVAMAGMQYNYFASRKNAIPPATINTRIYSCILLDNHIPFRWRGRYNEDTDLSLRILKAGLCTILVQAFLAVKVPTMVMRGGNTETLYQLQDGRDGRLMMAQSLQRQHPDVVTIKHKWGRWQHQVDYRPFRGNALKRDPAHVPAAHPADYGLQLVKASA